jgi:HAD superfamily hydrolase (TIGR01509 family)
MKNFDAVIFDMDGLLLDTERLAFDAFRSTCSLFNLGDLSKVYMKCIGTNSEMGKSILKDGLNGIANYEDFSLACGREYKKLTEGRPIPLKKGVDELLSHIENIGKPMAVATSTNYKNAKAELQNSGILHFFDHIVGGDQVKRSKPDPEIYLKTASALLTEPSKCLAFEDSKNGVKAAIAAGMTVVQIPDLVFPDEELLELGHIVLESLTDILDHEFSR